MIFPTSCRRVPISFWGTIAYAVHLRICTQSQAGFLSELSGLVPAGHFDHRAASCYAAPFRERHLVCVSNPVSTAQLGAEAGRRSAQDRHSDSVGSIHPASGHARFCNGGGTWSFPITATVFDWGRSAHRAVAQAQQYITEGRGWCVDLDLKKFFDRVNHERRMAQISKRVDDYRLLLFLPTKSNPPQSVYVELPIDCHSV